LKGLGFLPYAVFSCARSIKYTASLGGLAPHQNFQALTAKEWFFAIFNGFFRGSGRQGRGTIMNLDLGNSGRGGAFFRHFQRTEFLGQIAG
jgi:hypothetical protein